jgi:hypothetical protein
VTYLTSARAAAARLGDVLYQPILTDARSLEGGVEVLWRTGQPLRATTLERTLVDCVHRLNRAPAPLTLLAAFRSSRGVLRTGEMVDRVLETRSRVAVSRLAFFMWKAGCDVCFGDEYRLAEHGLQRPDYLTRPSRSKADATAGKWGTIGKWRLTVPPELYWFEFGAEEEVTLPTADTPNAQETGSSAYP